MPLGVKKIGGKWRLVNQNTGNIERHEGRDGVALDGGGHESPAKVHAQIAAIEASKRKKSG